MEILKSPDFSETSQEVIEAEAVREGIKEINEEIRKEVGDIDTSKGIAKYPLSEAKARKRMIRIKQLKNNLEQKNNPEKLKKAS